MLGGKYAGIAAAVLGVITLISMANSGVLAASRFPFAMSRDSLLPPFLKKLHPKYLTPVCHHRYYLCFDGFCHSSFRCRKNSKTSLGLYGHDVYCGKWMRHCFTRNGSTVVSTFLQVPILPLDTDFWHPLRNNLISCVGCFSHFLQLYFSLCWVQ